MSQDYDTETALLSQHDGLWVEPYPEIYQDYLATFAEVTDQMEHELEEVTLLEREEADIDALQEMPFQALENISDGYPETWTAKIQRLRAQAQQSSESPVFFTTRNPPDVSAETRILGIVGVNDEHFKAAPDADGHLLSDAYMFMHRFGGLGSSQTWMFDDTATPAKLVTKYGKKWGGYLFGDAYSKEPRRVVLNEAMLQNNSFPIDVVSAHPETTIRQDFLDKVRTESTLAMENKQPFLCIMIGHGEQSSFGFVLRDGLITSGALLEALQKEGDNTIVTTSCYSGGWNVEKYEPNGNNAYQDSSTLGRINGSPCTRAVANILVPVDGVRITPEITREIASAVLQLDYKYAEGPLAFAARDDDSDSGYSARTGFPLQDYERRYNALEAHPNKPGTILDIEKRALRVEEAGLAMDRIRRVQVGHRRVKYRAGHEPFAMHCNLAAHLRMYMDGFHGPWDDRGKSNGRANRTIHKLMEDIMYKPGILATKEDWELMTHLMNVVVYRLECRSIATALLIAAEIPLPYGLTGAEWNKGEGDFDQLGRTTGSDVDRDSDCFQAVVNANLFPEPTEELGPDWTLYPQQ